MSPVSDFRVSVAALAQDQEERLTKRLAEIDKERGELATELHHVRRVLKEVRPQEKPAKKKGTGTKATFEMSAERETQAVAWFNEDPEAEYTATKLRDHFGWSGSYCNLSLNWLRERGYVRLAATVGQTHIYRVVI